MRVDPAFTLTDAHAAAVSAICRHVDGLPLAIELAAARVTVLSPSGLLAQLTGPGLAASAGPRDLPVRQRTITTTIAWSYDLLSPAEQSLLRGHAVFAGGFTIEAASAMAAAGFLLGQNAEAAFSMLVEQSLLRRMERTGEPRFTLLETVREFALERLLERGEEPRARAAQLAYLLDLANHGAPAMLGPNMASWFSASIRKSTTFARRCPGSWRGTTARPSCGCWPRTTTSGRHDATAPSRDIGPKRGWPRPRKTR